MGDQSDDADQVLQYKQLERLPEHIKDVMHPDATRFMDDMLGECGVYLLCEGDPEKVVHVGTSKNIANLTMTQRYRKLAFNAPTYIRALICSEAEAKILSAYFSAVYKLGSDESEASDSELNVKVSYPQLELYTFTTKAACIPEPEPKPERQTYYQNDRTARSNFDVRYGSNTLEISERPDICRFSIWANSKPKNAAFILVIKSTLPNIFKRTSGRGMSACRLWITLTRLSSMA